MKRVFIYEGREFPDPDSNLSVDQVRLHMADFFPELSNASADTQKRGAGEGLQEVTTFTRRTGTKGKCKSPIYKFVLTRMGGGPGYTLEDTDLWGLLCALNHCLQNGYGKENEEWYRSMISKIEILRGN